MAAWEGLGGWRRGREPRSAGPLEAGKTRSSPLEPPEGTHPCRTLISAQRHPFSTSDLQNRLSP